MTPSRSLLFLAFPVLFAGLVRGDELFFDRDGFLDAIAGDVVIDFERDPLGPVVGDPWAAKGVVFDQAGTGDQMEIGDGGGADKNIYAQGGQHQDIDIGLTQTFHAFGLGVFSNNISVAGELIVFRGAGDVVLASVAMPATDVITSAFVGYVADEPILRVEFIEDDADGDYAGIGDVAFGAPNPIGLKLAAPVPGLAGMTNTLVVQNAAPGERVVFVLGATPGSTAGACPGIVLDLVNPQPIGVLLAAPDGSATITGPVPLSLAGTPFVLQALVPARCEVSNSITHTFL